MESTSNDDNPSSTTANLRNNGFNTELDESLLDDVPLLQEWGNTITLRMPKQDNKSFRTVFATDFEDALADADKMHVLSQKGNSLIQELYALRGCARALPVVSDPNQPRKVKLYTKTFNVLRPQMLKILEFISFHESIIQGLGNIFKKLSTAEARRRVLPDILSTAVVNLIDILITLDHLKDMKSSFQNDFSFYKRSFTYCKDDMEDEDTDELMDEIQRIQSFLSNPQHPKGLLFHLLCVELNKVSNFEDVVVELLKYCKRHLTKSLYIFANNKFKLVRVMSHLVIILTSATESDAKQQQYKLDSYVKLLKSYPVVPLYADMSICPLRIIASHSEAHCHLKEYRGKSTSLISTWHKMRQAYAEFLPRLSTGIRSSSSALNVVTEGISLLTEWKSDLLLCQAIKYQNPVETDTSGNEYERVVRYNYSSAELSAVVDIVGMIKSVASIFRNAEASVSQSVRSQMYTQVQTFCQHTMLPLLHRADKKQRSSKTLMLSLRSVAADWINNTEPSSEDYKAKKDKRVFSALKQPRSVPPSISQLEILRASVHSLYDDKAAGMTSTSLLFNKKDFDAAEVALLEAFYNQTFYYSSVLCLGETMEVLSNVSQLWLREFYLEMTKVVQFPIDMSLPWMLTQHIVTNPSVLGSRVIESIVYLLDIYNDASHDALQTLRHQFLFDEVEAEASLALDQLVYLLSDRVYRHYKDYAASRLLSCHQKQEEKNQFEVIMSQRHLNLLGKNIDLNSLITKHVNDKIAKDVEVSFQRLESSSDLSFILEFQSLIRVIELVHTSLAPHLPALHPLKDIYAEANDSNVCSTSTVSRIGAIVLSKVTSDLIPSFAYNYYTKRFVRTSSSSTDQEKSTSSSNVEDYLLFGAKNKVMYEQANRLRRGFIGIEHIKAIVLLLQPFEVKIVVSDCYQLIDELMTSIVGVCVSALGQAVPPCKLPNFMYKVEGCHGYFEGKLKPIFDYAEKNLVFQTFREIGNVLAFLSLLQSIEDVSATLVGNLNLESFEKVMQNVSETVADSDLASVASSYIASVGSSRNDTRPSSSYTTVALRKISSVIDSIGVSEEWSDNNSDTGWSFHRVWSALQYVYACPPAISDSLSDREKFGDGFILSGCAIIHVLNQRKVFETLDFTYHLLNVSEFYAAVVVNDDKVGKLSADVTVSAQQVIANAKSIVTLRTLYFDFLESQHYFNTKTPPCCFEPPTVQEEELSQTLLKFKTTQTIKS